MTQISQDEVENLLDPLTDIFRECMDAAWETYRTKYAEFSVIHHPRTRANIVYDHIIANLRTRLDRVGGVRFVEQRGLIALLVEGQLLLKFKKLTKGRLSRNIPTRQSRTFALQLPLPGLPGALANLVVGYQLNELQTDIAGIHVTCPTLDSLAWGFEIPRSPGADVVSMPVEPADAGPQELPFTIKQDTAKARRDKDA